MEFTTFNQLVIIKSSTIPAQQNFPYQHEVIQRRQRPKRCLKPQKIRSDTEVEGSEKLTGRDKAVLGFIWVSSFIYALLNDQVEDGVQHHQHGDEAGDKQGGEQAVQRPRGAQLGPCHCWSPVGPGKKFAHGVF